MRRTDGFRAVDRHEIAGQSMMMSPCVSGSSALARETRPHSSGTFPVYRDESKTMVGLRCGSSFNRTVP